MFDADLFGVRRVGRYFVPALASGAGFAPLAACLHVNYGQRRITLGNGARCPSTCALNKFSRPIRFDFPSFGKVIKSRIDRSKVARQ